MQVIKMVQLYSLLYRIIYVWLFGKPSEKIVNIFHSSTPKNMLLYRKKSCFITLNSTAYRNSYSFKMYENVVDKEKIKLSSDKKERIGHFGDKSFNVEDSLKKSHFQRSRK